LAVERFNPMWHQPQPPGYPLFVALLKVLSVVAPTIETAFFIAALVMSAAALALVWRLCEMVGGPGRGIIAALLLVFTRAFWLAALTNPVRLCSAAGAAAVVLCVWRACRGDSRRWLPAAAGALGLSAGFRPSLALLMAPLIIWAAFRIRVRWRVAALS